MLSGSGTVPTTGQNTNPKVKSTNTGNTGTGGHGSGGPKNRGHKAIDKIPKKQSNIGPRVATTPSVNQGSSSWSPVGNYTLRVGDIHFQVGTVNPSIGIGNYNHLTPSVHDKSSTVTKGVSKVGDGVKGLSDFEIGPTDASSALSDVLKELDGQEPEAEINLWIGRITSVGPVIPRTGPSNIGLSDDGQGPITNLTEAEIEMLQDRLDILNDFFNRVLSADAFSSTTEKNLYNNLLNERWRIIQALKRLKRL